MKPDERLLLMFSSYTVQKKPKMLQIYELYLALVCNFQHASLHSNKLFKKLWYRNTYIKKNIVD